MIQEEISVGIYSILSQPVALVDLCLWAGDRERIRNQILRFLKSKGCVLKVEGELPDRIHNFECDKVAYKLAQEDMLKAGYYKTEPLVDDAI